MASSEPLFEAEVIHDLPRNLAAAIGRVVVAHSKLEHNLTMMIAVLLQLEKVEARLALREPRPKERLDIVCDLFALKGIGIDGDIAKIRTALDDASIRRDRLAHGIWLRHPSTGEIHLRLTKGHWPQQKAGNGKLKRVIFPEAIPYGAEDCAKDLAQIEVALSLIGELGAALDLALETFPERFRKRSPVVDPLAGHNSKGRQPRKK